MKAIILAGGRGTRLRPLTNGIPKPLLPVKGRPMIDWIIRSIICDRIDEIIIGVPGTYGDDPQERMMSNIHGLCMENYIRSLDYTKKIRTIPTPLRETGGDLRYILEESGIRTGPVLVVYGDNLTQLNIDDLIDYHETCRRNTGTSATVVLFEAPESEVHRFGIAKINQSNGITFIENFIEKPNLQQAPSRYANAGYYVLNVEDVFDLLPRGRVKTEHSVFPALAGQGRLAGYVTKVPYWIDISTLEAYDIANKLAHDGLILPPTP